MYIYPIYTRINFNKDFYIGIIIFNFSFYYNYSLIIYTIYYKLSPTLTNVYIPYIYVYIDIINMKNRGLLYDRVLSSYG
jgi:hypothetical protein